MTLVIAIPMTMMAEDVTIDGINYSVIKKTKQAEVIKWTTDKYEGNITIPASVVYDGVTYSVTTIGGAAFSDCSGLTSVTIPDGVTSIGDQSFYKCSGLTSVTIPSSVTSIGNEAFYWCYGLTSITIPSSVTSIGNDTFYYCKGLTSITIPSSVTSIGEDAFGFCSGLTSVTIPSSVTSIGNRAFWGCSGLTSIDIHEGVTSIGEYAFRECTSLTSVTIPSSMKRFGLLAFLNCTSLNTVHISDIAAWCNIIRSYAESTPTFYANHLFLNNVEIKDLVIPDGVTTIGGYAFKNCSSIASVTIPSSVTTIWGAAFSDCSGLTSVTIGNSVTSIGTNAFANCEDLEVVTCLATTVPSTESTAFADSYVEYATLIVPDEAYDTYSTTAPWSNFGTKIKLSEATIVTANSYTREYGEPNPTFEYTSGTIVNGTPEITCEADENSPAGTYPITISQGSVTNPGLIFYNGTLTVTKAPLTITAKDYTVTVGDAMPTFEAEYEGFKNSDDETILTTSPTFNCAAANTNTEGIYDITVSGAASDRYDITYVKGQLTIVPTDVTITISSAGMATYCSPYDLDFSGVKNLKAYIISGYDWANKKVFATRVYDVPAGTGLYLVGQQGEYHVSIGSTSCYYINMLVGTTSSITLEPTDGDVTNLILTGTSPQNASFKTLAASRNFGANKAYLQIPTSVLSSSANAVGIIFDDETNGIESISSMGHANGDWFTIDGRRLNSRPAQKGVYILNGNKIVIK